MKKQTKNNCNEKEDIDNIHFLPTIPVENVDEYKIQISALKKSIETEDVSNIGIVAPYGAGKSSIIKTFLNHYPSYKKRTINISLATFKAKKEGESKEGQKKSNNLSPEDLKNAEKSILEQLFYSVEKTKVPLSNIKRIHDRGPYVFFTIFFSASTVLLTILSVLFFNNKVPGWNNPHFSYFYWFFCSALVSLFFLLIFGITLFNKIKIAYGNLEVDLEYDKSDSILNAFIDEILYFFIQTKKTVVVFEDIDRFESVELLSKLREINQIVNNNACFKGKNKRIRFVYCVKDGLFANYEERSKFFDFVVPTFPIITTETVKTKLEESLKEACKDYKKLFNSSFLFDISLYISDKRTINNIVNDFVLYKSQLEVGDENEKLFSMMVYKNLYYDDYTQLLKGDGFLFDIFNGQKKEAIDCYLEDLLNEEKNINLELDKINRHIDNDSSSFINVLGGILVKHGTVATRPYYSSAMPVPSNYFNLEQFMNLQTKDCKGLYISREDTFYYLDVVKLKALYGEDIFVARDRLIKQSSGFYTEKLKEIQYEKNNIQLISAAELIGNKKYNEKTLKDLKDDKKFIMFAINNGYIDETYFRYISKSASSIDIEVIKDIVSKNHIEANIPIENPNDVISRVPVEHFGSKQILIYSLVESLSNSEDKNLKNKKDKFTKYLSSRTQETMCFVSDYWNNNKDILSLVRMADANYKYILYDLLKSPRTQNKDNLIRIMFSDLKLLKDLNVENVATDYIENHETPIHSLFGDYNDTETVFNILNQLGISKLKHLNCNQDSSFEKCLLNDVIDDLLYEINYGNLLTIVNNEDRYMNATFFLTGNKKDYYKANITELLKALVEGNKQLDEELNVTEMIIASKDIPIELRCSFASLVSSPIPYTEGLELDIYKTCFDNDKYCKWSDLESIFKNKDTKKYDFKNYVNKNYKKMSGKTKDSEFILSTINDIDYAAAQALVESIDDNLQFNANSFTNDKILSLVIESNNIDLKTLTIDIVANKKKSIKSAIKAKPELVDCIDSIDLKDEEYHELILSDLSLKSKAKIIIKSYKKIAGNFTAPVLDEVINVIKMSDSPNGFPLELLVAMYENSKKYEETSRTNDIEMLGLSILNGKDLTLFIEKVDRDAYSHLSDNGKFAKKVYISKDYYKSKQLFKALESRKLIVSSIRINGVNYTINVEKLFEYLKIK